MICHFCGKSSPDNHDYCLYCGKTQINISPLYLEYKEQIKSSPSGSKENIYELIDKTEHEWACSHKNLPLSKDSDDAAVISDAVSDNRVPDTGALSSQSEKFMQKAGGYGSVAELSGRHEREDSNSGDEAYGQSSEHPAGAYKLKKYSQEQTDDDIIRTTLAGRYEILEKLGEGGMANVYRARDIALNREVAVKILPRAFFRDEQFIKRFKREAKLAAMLEHPNIFKIYEISEEHGLCYFVMNYIPGGTLTEQMKLQDLLPLDTVIRWSRDICSALSHAHELGIIHRDLKPDNIMIDKNNSAVVMDFGIAHAARGTNLTQTGAVLGTPQYMSPDQACGKELDARSDIYSLGMVLYLMATGRLPFLADDPVSLMYMHVHETPKDPDVLNPDIPRWLNDIIMKCLEKNPDNRFSSARELRFSLAAQKSPIFKYARFIKKIQTEKPQSIGAFVYSIIHLLYAQYLKIMRKIANPQKQTEKSDDQSIINTIKPGLLNRIRPKPTVVFNNIAV